MGFQRVGPRRHPWIRPSTGVLTDRPGGPPPGAPYLPGGKAISRPPSSSACATSSATTSLVSCWSAPPCRTQPQLLDVCLEAFRGPILQRASAGVAVHWMAEEGPMSAPAWR